MRVCLYECMCLCVLCACLYACVHVGVYVCVHGCVRSHSISDQHRVEHDLRFSSILLYWTKLQVSEPFGWDVITDF